MKVERPWGWYDVIDTGSTYKVKSIQVETGKSLSLQRHMHRLSNPGKIPLKIIEVQSGPYLEEDDIERFEDDHGRD